MTDGTPRALLLGVLLATLAAIPALGQTIETGRGPVRGLPAGARNGVFVLESDGARLFAGPQLVIVEADGTPRFAGDDPAFDPLTAVNSRVFSVAARGNVVWVGLGFTDVAADAEEPPLSAAGFAVSTDGGGTWTYRPPALDQPVDTLVTYGVSTLRAVPVQIPQYASPLDLALTADGDTVYAATDVAGLRRSTDRGRTWTRVALPPDSLFVLDPRRPYDFVYAPSPFEPLPEGEAGTRVEIAPGVVATLPGASANLAPLSVFVDEAGVVWVGTGYGLNRSVRLPGSRDPAWIRYIDSPLGGGPVGNAVTVIRARPTPGGRDPVWVVCRQSGIPDVREDEENGVVVWRGDDRDGFPIFETVLLGAEIYDLAFDDVRAYAAGREGLYVSDDDGASWRVLTTFPDIEGRPAPLGTFGVRSVATTPGAVWVGTTAGLLRSVDGARTWTLFRANVAPSDRTGGAPDVDVYAYPNPYAPSGGLLRVRFDLDAPADVTLRVYDFAMNPVRTVEAPGRPTGPNEVFWDGRTDDGTRTANGPYFYTVDAGGRQRRGKILVFQ